MPLFFYRQFRHHTCLIKFYQVLLTEMGRVIFPDEPASQEDLSHLPVFPNLGSGHAIEDGDDELGAEAAWAVHMN